MRLKTSYLIIAPPRFRNNNPSGYIREPLDATLSHHMFRSGIPGFNADLLTRPLFHLCAYFIYARGLVAGIQG